MLELKELNLLGELNDEQDILESFINDYQHSTYVCDAISEAADSATPIHYSEIKRNAWDVEEYVAEAIANGLVDTSSRNFDLMKMFQAGYYEYYNQSLYTNLDTLVYNHIVREINEYLNELDGEVIEELDMDAVEEHVEDEAGDFDNNNQFSIIDDIIEGTKELINEQIEELEESEEE